MSSKTKIVVLHLKELIYTGIFAVLGILFIILLVIMFLPKDKNEKDSEAETEPDITTSYIPGVYTTSLVLSDHAIDVEVIVDQDLITSVRLVNLDEAITTMYPLIQPAFNSIAEQIYEKQSLEGITYSDENKYTSLVLLDAVRTSLEKAIVTMDVDEGILP
ncbi:MAG: hypothetical protein ACI4TB_11320 [Lachnospiraceae bacterium]